MFEYDKELVSRILKLENFDSDNLNLDQIKHVPMHQYRVSSREYPLLLVENLQVCIGVYAYSENFGFAAHINPVVMRENEFECDDNRKIIYCNRIDDLFNAIINTKIKKHLYIGIMLGFCPVQQTYAQVDMIDKNIDQLISKLSIMGIKATKLDLQYNHIFILDTINGGIITPINQITKEMTKNK